MKGLTLHRPWDFAITRGGKDIENRPWKPWPEVIGQRIALHAGQKYDYDGAEFIRSVVGARATPMPETMPGVIVGVTTVVGWVRVERSPVLPDWELMQNSDVHASHIAAALRSRWLMGPYGWLLRDTIALPSPVPCKGALALWRLPTNVEAAVLEQLPSAETRTA